MKCTHDDHENGFCIDCGVHKHDQVIEEDDETTEDDCGCDQCVESGVDCRGDCMAEPYTPMCIGCHERSEDAADKAELRYQTWLD